MLILASASPRRHELLEAAGIPHVVKPASVCEERRRGEGPRALVRRLAEAKAEAALPLTPGDVILGADTTVALDGEIFEKPEDDEQAASMLRRLSGREHSVYTGICIVAGDRRIVDVARTRVRFAKLSEDEIHDYIRSGEPRDKAGAYAIQGLASKFVVSVAGCYANVVGLPVSLVYYHLKAL